MAYEKEADQRVDSREEARFAEEKKFAYSVVKRITRSIIRMLQN